MKTTNKENKILFLHGSNDLYGASKVLVNIIRTLEHNNHIYLILPYKGPLDKIFGNNVKIYHRNLGVFRKKYFSVKGILNRLNKIFFSVLFINNLIKKNKINLVYTNTSVIVAGGISAKLNFIESFFHIHEMPTNKFYFTVIRKIIDFTSNKIIVVSKVVKNHWKFKSEFKVKMIYNAIEDNGLIKIDEKLKNKVVFVSISRLLPYKGHVYLFQIVRELKKHIPECFFYIVGDTFPGYEYYESKLKNYVNDYNINNNILFTGYSNDITHYLKKTDFLVHTPIEPDPLPTVILEAMSFGTPVIASKIGGNIELLDNGRCGLLIPHDDVVSSVKKIIKFINNRDNVNDSILNSKKHIKAYFAVENFKKNILSLFN